MQYPLKTFRNCNPSEYRPTLGRDSDGSRSRPVMYVVQQRRISCLSCYVTSSESIHVEDTWNLCPFFPQNFYGVHFWSWCVLTSYVFAHPSYNCWVPCTVSGHAALLASDRNEVVILLAARSEIICLSFCKH